MYTVNSENIAEALCSKCEWAPAACTLNSTGGTLLWSCCATRIAVLIFLWLFCLQVGTCRAKLRVQLHLVPVP